MTVRSNIDGGIPDVAESMAMTRGGDDDDKLRRKDGVRVLRERERLNARLSAGFAMMNGDADEAEPEIEADNDD